MELLIATGNPGKVREYDELLDGLPITCIGPSDLGIDLDVDESGDTYEQNATLKALAFARASGRVTLADDSGLEVDALSGRPGVRSARYGGPGMGDADRWRLLLQELEGVPAEARTARFRCAIALATPAGEVRTVEGSCEGRITFEAAGDNGFGYDPVFFVLEEGRTMAQLPSKLKNQISHRGRAARAAKPVILELLDATNGDPEGR
jgi:XTP/dITP diphosphohydrolase